MRSKFMLKLVLIVLFISVIRIFLIDSYKITSDSMEGSLLVGDNVILNKLAYGARIPSAFGIPFIGSDNPLFRIAGLKTHTENLWHSFRLPGFSHIKRNDILAFHIPKENAVPIDFKTVYIKRCIGLPGDKVRIHSGLAIVNGKTEKSLKSYQWQYQIVTKIDLQKWKSQNNVNENLDAEKIKNALDGNFVYLIRTIPEVITILKSSPEIISVKELTPSEELNDLDIFPHDIFYKNNIYSTGEIILPKKGMKIVLDSTNYKYLSYLLRNFEDIPIQIKGKGLYVNNIPLRSHVFKHDYFYMLGDNRSNSYDSRYWGPVPDSHLIGRVSFIFFSRNTNIKWNRIFKPVI